MKYMKKSRLLQIMLIFTMILILSGVTQVSFASESENLLDTESIPDQRNINLTISNHESTRYSGDDSQYAFFTATGGGLNAMQMRPDNSSLSGVYTTTSNKSGTFYIIDTGGQGFSNTMVLMISVNGTISPDFQIDITSHGPIWDYVGKPTSASDVRYGMGINETYTISDFMYNSTWKPANSPQPIFQGQDTTDLSNMFYSMFIDLDVGTYGSSGHAQIDYIIKNLGSGSIVAFNIYAVRYGTNSNPTWFSSEWTNNAELTGFLVYNNVIDIYSSMDNAQIQELINNANPDYIIRFAAGNYHDLQLNIPSTLEIIADGIVNIIGSGTGTAFNILGNNVIIDGFNIENYEIGITAQGNNITIKNNNIKSKTTGISTSGNKNIIYNNEITGPTNSGIAAHGNNTRIIDNNISGSKPSSNGISVANGENITIAGNIIKDTGNYAISASAHTSKITINNNAINNASVGIRVRGNDNTIKNNTILNTRTPLDVGQTTNNTISDNIPNEINNINNTNNTNNINNTNNNANNNNTNNNNKNNNTSTVTKTTLTINNFQALFKRATVIKATLRDSRGKAIVGKQVNFFVNGKLIGKSKTNSKGVVSTKYIFKTRKSHKVHAKFVGDSKTLTSNSKTLRVIPKNKTQIKLAKVIQKGKKATFKVTLRNNLNKAMKNSIVKFYANGHYIGKAKTNSKGIATLTKIITAKGTSNFIAKTTYGGTKTFHSSTTSRKATVMKK